MWTDFVFIYENNFLLASMTNEEIQLLFLLPISLTAPVSYCLHGFSLTQFFAVTVFNMFVSVFRIRKITDPDLQIRILT
jgi:hypothetical protein